MTVCEKETSYAECVTASFEVSLQLSGRRGRETGKETDRRGEEERGDGEIIGQRDWARGARGREGREGEAFCARGPGRGLDRLRGIRRDRGLTTAEGL